MEICGLKMKRKKKLKKFINYEGKSGYIYQELIKKYNIGILTAIVKNKFLKESKIFFDSKYNIIGDFDFFIRLSKKYKFEYIHDPVATYRIHDKNLSLVKKNLQIKEFFDWLKNNKKTLAEKNYIILRKKIINLQFNDLSLTENFINKLIFFLSHFYTLYNFKNIIALFMPKFLLKKFVWFN